MKHALLWGFALVAVASCQRPSGAAQEIQVGGGLGLPVHVEHQVAFAPNAQMSLALSGSLVDMGFRSTITVGAGNKLVVYPAGGNAPVEFRRMPISVEYYHVGHVLVVTEGPEASRTISDFADPIRWSTAPLAAPAP